MTTKKLEKLNELHLKIKEVKDILYESHGDLHIDNTNSKYRITITSTEFRDVEETLLYNTIIDALKQYQASLEKQFNEG